MLAPNLEVIDRLKRQMQSRYGVAPEKVRVVKAPYRICPLGAHIDHQLGWVTAMTIDQAVFLAYAPSGSREMRRLSAGTAGRFTREESRPDERICTSFPILLPPWWIGKGLST